VLRPGGQFAAATVGRTHMAGLRELVRRFIPDLPPEAVAQSDHFLLENAVAQLEPFFDEVQLERQPNALEVTEAGPLVEYVLSMWGYREALEGREQAFAGFVAGEIAARGAVRIAKEIGLLTGRGPRRAAAADPSAHSDRGPQPGAAPDSD
jgi:hypothetical protein